MTQEQTTLPRRCRVCGYSLHGLPDAGQCPECGKVYTADQLALYGWGRGLFISHLSRGRRGLFWGLLMTIFVFLRPREWAYALTHLHELDPSALMLVASVPMVVGAAVLQRRWNRIAEPLRLSLNRQGLLVEPSNQPDSLTTALMMAGLALYLVSPNLRSPSPYAVLFAVPMIVMVPLGWIIARRNQQRRAPTPWSDLEFSASSSLVGRCRLRFKRRHHTSVFRTVADIELGLSTAQVEELRRQLTTLCPKEKP